MLRFLLAGVFVVTLGVACTSQEPVCRNGQCPIVAVPKAEPVRESVQAVASVPVKVVKQVRTKRPLRSFLRRVFR